LSDIDFSSLPNKKYYSISEVSTLLGIKQTEIRYWEKFEPKLRSKGTTRAYDLKKLKLLIRYKEAHQRSRYKTSETRSLLIK
jgi:DNA-binding transcriptional MerR regulator